jgi:hypothetical protein
MTARYHTTATNNATADHKNRAADLGLRLTSTNSCPRRLINKPHLEEQCWCTSRLNDHGRRYRTSDNNEPIVMWEPYSFDPEALGIRPPSRTTRSRTPLHRLPRHR